MNDLNYSLPENLPEKSRGIKVLALDDDKVIVAVLESIFKKSYTFKTTTTIKDFKEEIESFNPDIVMIDVLLPDGNGIELCRELRSQKRYGQLYILILTSFDDQNNIERAYSAGANDYIRKPFIPYEINSKIMQVARSLKAEREIFDLYSYQKDFNQKLYNFTNLINQNINIKNKEQLIESLFKAAEFLQTEYTEIVFPAELSSKKGAETHSTKKSYSDKKIEFLSYEKLKKKISRFKFKNHYVETLELTDHGEDVIHCHISEVFFNKNKEGYFILEKSTPFAKGSAEMLSLYLDFVNVLGVDIFARNMMKNQIQKGRSDLAKVRTIQVSLLPHFEDVKYFDIASSFIPMEDVSGDFFDGYYLNDEVYQLILCDVSGHGIASSYIGNSIRSILRTTVNNNKSPGETLAYLNNELVHSLPNIYYFSTIVLCQLNIKTGEIALASGGHPPCLYYDSEKNIQRELTSTGPLVGLIEGAEYHDINIKMRKEDCLFMYTDGVIEAPGVDGEMFGDERLLERYRQSVNMNSIDIVHAVLGSLYEHNNYSSLDDDITILCIKKA